MFNVWRGPGGEQGAEGRKAPVHGELWIKASVGERKSEQDGAH